MGKEGSILAYAAPAVEPEPATAFCTRAAYQEMRPYVVLERPMTAHRGGLFKQRRDVLFCRLVQRVIERRHDGPRLVRRQRRLRVRSVPHHAQGKRGRSADQ